jgi:predicted ATP-binding protein involved in virulence
MNSSNFSKKILKEGRSLPRTFAYYGWSAENNCADIWQDRLIDQLLISKTKDYSESKEVDYVKSKLKTFTEPLEENYPNDNTEFVIKDVNVRGPRGGLYLLIEFKDDRKMRFDQLPQGFNRTLSIVLDLAYRSYVLNKNIDSTGVVIIDEIELHLHPSLQKEILTRLQKTFPMLQFIVTTHSPLVLSNIKADGIKNKIISLENKGNNYFSQEVEDNYGVNYSTSLQETMGTRYRHSTIDKLIDSYVYLNQKGQTENAQKMYQKLIDFLGGNISNELKKEIEEKIKSKSL